MQVPLSSSSAPWEVPRLPFPPSHPTPIASCALHHTLAGSRDVTSRALATWFGVWVWVQVQTHAVSAHLPQDTRTSLLAAAASLSLPATHPVREVLRLLL